MKIKKPAKRLASPPSDVAAVVDKIANSTNDDDIIPIFNEFPIWRYQRGDLAAWIPALDRFDDVLANIIKGYDLGKPQTNEFTPKTKELLLGILRLTRLLLENCTSRKLYSSYERLADLLFTTDLDVLHSTLLLFLRPGQNYGCGTPMDAQVMNRVANRLLTLTKGWEQFDAYDAVQLATLDSVEPASTKITIQFYPEEGSSSSISTLDLDISLLQTPDQIVEVAEQHKISTDDQLALLNKSRILSSDKTSRQKLYSIRLLAIATYVFYTPEDASQSSIFLYETTLVHQIAQLLVPGRGVGDDILSAAIYAIDACAHHKNKSSEVIAAVGANVNHGILISLVRDTIRRLTAGEEVLFEVVDALMTLVAYVATSPPYSNQIIGAGIIPLLLEIPKTTVERRVNYIARTIGLIDAIIFGVQQGLTAFGNADGINTMVKILKAEIDLLMERTLPAPTYALAEDTITSYYTIPIKSTLRSIQRLMQATGGAEGMRNLVDSDLPKLLKQIFDNAPRFGPRVFALAINTMAAFVHNEPTSLSVLQELGLPQALFAQLEKEFPTTHEVVGVVPNAIGAICLNQAGIDFTLAHPAVIEKLVNLSTSSDHAHHLGQSLDELVRHHPPLRSLVLAGLLGSLTAACQEGAAFVPKDEEERKKYLLTDADVVGVLDQPADNEPLRKLVMILNVLQGVLRNSTLAKEFIDGGGLDRLLDIADLPCIPMQAGHAPSGISVATITVFSTLGEHDQGRIAKALIESVRTTMDKVPEMWQGEGEWIGLGDKLPILRGLTIRLAYLSNFFAAVSAGPSKSATPLLQVLGEAENLIHDVGLLHRKTMLAVANFRVNEAPKEDGTPEETKGSGGKYLSTRLFAGLTKMFKSFVRLLFFKRTPEPAHRTLAQELAVKITNVLIGHCDFSKSVEGPVGVCYNTIALGATLMQLFDDRGHEGHLHMVLFIVFEKKGGVGKILEFVAALLDNVERPGLEGADKTRATSGVTVALETLSALVRPKAIMSNPQTHVLQQRTELNFSPLEMFIRIRRDIFPYAKRVWDSEWLQHAPVKVAHKGVRSFLTIMEGKDEKTQSGLPLQTRPVVGPPTVPVVRAPVVADPAAVAQLVDMGFPRGSAEQALIRARNDVAGATEMILSMPHIFEAAAAAAPAPAAPAEPVTTQEPLVVDGAEGEAPPAAMTETAPATTADSMEVDRTPTPPPTETAEGVKKALDDMRAQEKPNLPTRAMALLSGEDALMFDLIPAFPADESALTLLLKNFSKDEDEKLIANKLRLFSILSVAHEIPELSEANTNTAYSIIESLPIDAQPRPSWLTSVLCFAETVMVLSVNVKTVKVGDAADSNVEIAKIEQQDRILTACRGILAGEATQTELVTAYRCMVVISKYNQSIEFADCLAPFKLKLDARLSTCHQLLAMILRHGFEDRPTLDDVMQGEIRTFFNRDKVTEVSHFVRQLRQVTSRHSDAFVDAVEKECTLVDPAPVAGVFHIRGKSGEQAAKPSDPFSGSTSHPTMNLLVKELGVATKETLKEETVPEGYTGLVFSLLTEVTGSYISAKKAFMDALRDTGVNGPKARNGLSPIVNDLVGCVELDRDLASNKGAKPTRRTIISGWAISMLVALCSDITPVAKNVPEDLTIIRRTVLDAIVKLIKESSTHEANVRYGKLWAVGELVYRLLTSKPGIAPRDDSSLQIAKAMVEKNFVGLMTDAMGGVDLNFPNIKVTLVSLLRALDHLSKISIKWNKVEKKDEATGDREGSPSSSSSDGESDIAMDGIDEEGPDLYRNSALGILGGEMEDESGDEGDEDDGDDDMLDIYGDDDMEDDDEADTEPSDTDGMDDDEDMEGDEEEWTDEDGEDEEMDQEVVIGTEEPDWDQDEAALEEGDEMPFLPGAGAPPHLAEEFEEYLDGMLDEGGEDDDEDEDMMEDMMDGPEDFELEGDEDEELLLDELDEAGDAEIVVHAPAAASGHWGWATDPRAGRQDRSRSRLMIDSDPMSALFGPPPPSSQSLIQHPLLTNPAYAEANQSLINSPSAASNPDGVPDLGESMVERMGPDAARLVENVLARHREAGRQQLSIGMSSSSDGGIAIDIGGRRYTFPPPSQQNRTETAAAAAPEVDISAEFIPKPTLQRWHDEMAVCGDDSVKLVNHIINRLLPEAKVRAAAEAEKTKKLEQEAKEAEEKVQEEARKVEAEKAKQEEEARKADAAAAAEVALPVSRNPTPVQDVDMEADTPVDQAVDVSADQAADVSADQEGNTTTEEAGPSDDPTLARIIITIHGRDVDITGTGIDLEFLQALPDEMRADVVEQHRREHNRNRDNVPDTSGSSQISPEFLDALPDEIRSEVMLQEQMERARRARAQAETQAAQPAVPAPAPPAGLTASAGLADIRRRLEERRDQLIADPSADMGAMFDFGPGGALAGLGDELSQVMGLLARPGVAVPPIFRQPLARPRPAETTAEPSHKRSKRDAVQLLDKPGVASLVRLLFFPEAFKKDYLFRVLVNLCENSSTRTDLLNLLVSVVQDGTGDLLLVDKSFSQMSLKPGVTPKATPKTPKMPDTPAPQPSPSNLFAKLQADHIPTFIAQRCFEALTHIVASNSMAVNFFLTEHEQPVGLRKPLSKKGKGKEKLIPQTKFPIVVLLGFLDRAVLLRAPGMMESFTLLLSATTKPLATLKITDVEEDKKTAESTSSAGPAAAADTPAAVTQTPRAVATPAKAKVGESSTAPASSSTLTRAPVIPASVLKLVVNCLTVGECSSRTHGYTLSIMQHLSTIPGAKTIILDELRDRAQQLGQDILAELQELHTTLKDESAELGTAALAKFSPASSSQAQLLRLLKTIDYLHSQKVDSDPPGEVLTEQEKAIAQTFDSFDFEAMWKQLSECLSTVDARGSTDQISTVLLPLVEALMVICKYRRPEARETRSPSVPPSSTDETDSLFVTFTTTHRKVLNAIVRTNPGLLSGSFSLLVRNPRVLEFDNKRNWFLQKLKRKRDQPAHSPVLHLNIRRQYVFEDSFRALERRTGNEVKYGKLSVKFYNEDGIDAGGVTREWYSVLAQQIFDPNFALFEPCAADAQTYQPNKASGVNGDHLAYFKFVGRVIGKAVFDGRLLDAYFSRAFYKQILGKTVDMRDLESIDPEYHKSLQWMLDNDITDVIDQEFTIEDDQFGEKKVVELKEGGAEISVTEENKEEYVRLVVGYRVENSIKDQIKSFLNGFYEVIPRKLVQIFEADQLELLISGITSVDVDELKNSTQMSGWKSGDPEISWFWRALRSFSQEERARFLMFVTSSSRVPLGGFTQLQGASGIQPFQIQKLYSKEGSLPQASTCFNLLLLPKYETYEQLRERLMFAIYETGGFGKA